MSEEDVTQFTEKLVDEILSAGGGGAPFNQGQLVQMLRPIAKRVLALHVRTEALRKHALALDKQVDALRQPHTNTYTEPEPAEEVEAKRPCFRWSWSWGRS